MKHLLQGILIGLAAIIPGVSGGTIAVSMGIYDRLIYSTNHLFQEFRKSFTFLFPILAGAVIAMVSLSFLIEIAFERFPLSTNALFIGMILGGLPAISDKLSCHKISTGHILACVLFFLLTALMAFGNPNTSNHVILSGDFSCLFRLFFVGIIAAATMVIPGVSGSMILLMLGYYHPIIETINRFVKGFLAFDITRIFSEALLLIPFGLGVVLGIFAIARIMEIVFAKFPAYTYMAIIGLIAASPFAILAALPKISFSIIYIPICIIFFIAGFITTIKLGD